MIKRLIGSALSLIIILSSVVAVSADTEVSKPSATKLVTVKNSAGGVLINWTANDNAEGYYIFRKTAKTSYSKIATVQGSTTVKYTDKTAKSNTKYAYTVKAYNSVGASASCKSKSVLRVGTPNVTVANKASAIKISWKKISGATKYVVAWKKHSAKSYKVMYKGTKTSVVEDNIGRGESYDIKVKAVIGKVSGAYCTAKTKVFLEAPSIHAEEYPDMLGITLEWQGVKNAEGYYIYRSVKTKNSYKKIKTIKTKKTKDLSYIDGTCKSIESYKYYIVAFNGSDKSAKSNVDSDVFGYFVDDDTPLSLTISKGQVYKDINKKLKAYSAESLISWKSSNSKVVKVSSNGIITGVKKGKATLTAKGEYGGKKRHVYINVTVK